MQLVILIFIAIYQLLLLTALPVSVPKTAPRWEITVNVPDEIRAARPLHDGR